MNYINKEKEEVNYREPKAGPNDFPSL